MLATVYGDVHDIGKSLVNTILSNNGYTVFDLGKQVPVNTIIEKALEVGADAIGLSALLVSTSKQMPLCVQELDRRGLQIPVLIGGAAINRRFGRRALFVEGERAYESGRLLLQGRVRGARDDGRAAGRRRRARRSSRSCSTTRATTSSCATNVGKDIARGDRRRRAERRRRTTTRCRRAPFFGARVLRRHSARRGVRRCSTSTSCIACSGAGAARARSTRRRCASEFEPTLARLKAEAKRDGWLEAAAPCTATSRCRRSGNDLIVYDPDGVRSATARLREIARFHFPRQEGRERLCIADYFRSVGVGDVDVVGVPDRDGRRRGDAAVRDAAGAGEYTEAFYLHGLAVETAEAVAEWMHRTHAPRARRSGRPGQALLVGLRRVSRSRGSRAALQAAAGRARRSAWS